MPVLLQARGLGHHAGQRELFRGLDVVLNDGDRVGLVGHNGSGKSTLLGLLGGEIVPDDGDIQRRRGLRLSRVEQFLPAHLAALSLLDAVAERGPADTRWRAEVLLDAFAFGAAERRQQVGTLSGGQQKLVALARALMCGTRLLLLDEPFEGVAPVLANRLADVIAALRDEGIAIVLTESGLTHSRELLDRIYTVDRGEVNLAQA